MYWEVTEDLDEEYANMGARPDFDYDMDFSWIRGSKFDEQWPSALEYHIDLDCGNLIPDMMTTGTPIVTKKFIEVLESLGIDNFQTFEMTLLDKKSKKVKKEFVVFNLLDRFDCVDMENSVYKPMEGSKRLYFKKTFIDNEKTAGKLIFRANEAPSAIFIHDSVKKALEEAELFGLEFIKASF